MVSKVGDNPMQIDTVVGRLRALGQHPGMTYKGQRDCESAIAELEKAVVEVSRWQSAAVEAHEEIWNLTKEINRLKKVPMKYRRMEFNAQLQKENEQLRAALSGVLRHFDGDPHACDLEWVALARGLAGS